MTRIFEGRIINEYKCKECGEEFEEINDFINHSVESGCVFSLIESDIIMTNAEGDVIRYWRKKCDICAKKHPSVHEKCNEDSWNCKTKDIRVY